MNINDIKRKLIINYANFRGFKTDRKIVVFESDDWGSIRMPSNEVYNKLLAKGYPVDRLSYLKYDSLESNSDLEMLFEVLTSFKDKNGNHPVITANTIVSNPDFEKIRASSFLEYHSELFTETLKRYPERDRVFELHKLGIKKKIFYPQLHGMEHVNVGRWMKSLRGNNEMIRFAFDNQLFDLSEHHTFVTKHSFMDTLHPASQEDLILQGERLQLATQQFKELYGYYSKTFIAPCYIWNRYHEKILKNEGVVIMQSGLFQKNPIIQNVNQYSKKLHYTGQRNEFNQIYTVRNCAFEPSNFQGENIVERTLNQIRRSFHYRKPAIISTHRLNFIGSLDMQNRQRNLEDLNKLIKSIIVEFPDVEFLTSDDLYPMLK